MNQRTIRAMCGLFVAGLAAAPLAACASHQDAPSQAGGSPGAAVSSSDDSGSGALGGPSEPPASPEPTSGANAARACSAGDFKLAQLPGGDAASGTVIVAIQLTNTSAQPCQLNGYPTFTLAAGGRSLSATIQHGGMPIAPINEAPQPVTVKPATRAGFLLVYQNRPASGTGTCSTATTMSLKLGSATVSGGVQVLVCGPAMKVSPYVAGNRLAT